MATRDEIKEKVIDIVVEQLQVSRDQVNEGASLVDDLGADSLDVAEVIMELEDEFDINVPDDEEAPKSIGDAVDYIVKQTASSRLHHRSGAGRGDVLVCHKRARTHCVKPAWRRRQQRMEVCRAR